VKLTILGGHGTYPVAGGSCSGYLLEHDGFRLWMDAGNGTLGKLLEHWSFEDVDAIWISHAHADHSVDLYPFFYRMLSTGGPRVPVLAPSGVRDRLARLIGADSLDAWRSALDWRPVDPGDETELGPFTLRGSSAEHTSPNTVLRIAADGRTLTYTGDTGPTDAIVEAARDADVFLCEASWVDPSQVFSPIHLLASQAGEYARDAGVDRLVLTHVWAANDPARVHEDAAKSFRGEIQIAYACDPIEV
jgi:ribonuclease BN (tRNA processing enzyme)